MPRPSAIPPNREEDVLRLAGEGKSTREISAWLAAVGVEASYSAVARWLDKRHQERASTTKTVLAEKLSKTVTADIDRLDAIASRLERYERKAAKAKEFDVAIRAGKAAADVVSKKLHFSGADKPEEGTGAKDLASLLAQAFTGSGE